MKNFILFVIIFINFVFNTVHAQSVFSRDGITIPTLEINLYARAMNGTMFLADGILQNFSNNYIAEVDNMDVRKFMNASDNLAIKNGNYNLIVERRPNITVTDTLRLMLTGTRIAPYRFEIDPSLLNYPNISAFLIDKFLQSETVVSLRNVTSVNFEITSDPLSSAANRFLIVYRLIPPVRIVAISATRNLDHSITTRFVTENENNVNFYSIERSTDSLHFEAIATQMPTANNYGAPYYSYVDAAVNADYYWYRIKENAIGGRIAYSAVAKALKATTKTEGTVQVFPNPIINNVINLVFKDNTFGPYSLALLNSAGQLVYVEKVNIKASILKKSIYIPSLQKGIYRLIITSEKGQKKVLTLLAN